MSIKRTVGERLFLNLQLHDGEENFPLTVVVNLFNATGDQINSTPIELTHISNGYFSESTEVMPDVPFLIALYTVIEPTGSICPHYTQESDRFDRVVTSNVTSDGIVLTPKPFAVVARFRANQRVKSLVISCLLYTSPSPRDRG